MKTVEELRTRIANVEDVQAIVSIMKTMAAIQIRQYEAAGDALAEYLRTIRSAFHVLLRDRPIPDGQVRLEHAGAIIFGSDQGLCGQFNEEVVRYAQADMDDLPEAEWRVMIVGGRAQQFLEAPMSTGTRHGTRGALRGSVVEHVFRLPATVAGITSLLQGLVPQVSRWQNEGVGRINVYFNSRTSAATFAPEKHQLYPLSRAFLQQCQKEQWASRGLPAYTMGWPQLFAAVVRQYLFVGLFRACAESRASENASRIAAMQAAGKNIERRLHQLQAELNETRQSAITEEIQEIVAGVEALSVPRKPTRCGSL